VLYDWASSVASHSISGVPLVAVCVFGFAGLLVDIDHPIAYYWLNGLSQRFLHPYVFLLGWVILGVASAFISGLLFKTFLMGMK
jgi:hypothetical protein